MTEVPVTTACNPHMAPEARAQWLTERVLSPEEAWRLAEVFKTLADPTRIRLIALLAEGEICVHELAQALGMSSSAVSHQLRLLRHQGLVRSRRQGRHIFYQLDDEHVLELLQQVRAHLAHQPREHAQNPNPTGELRHE